MCWSPPTLRILSLNSPLRAQSDETLHAVTEGLGSEIRTLRSDFGTLHHRFDGFEVTLSSEVGTLQRDFNVVAESLRSDIRSVAEGFVAINEKFDRIETLVSERFAELAAMIRLSFGELEKRIQ